MIQGAKYSIWCQEEFNETLKMVNDMAQTGSSSIMSPVRDTHMLASASTSLDDSVTFKKQTFASSFDNSVTSKEHPKSDESQPSETLETDCGETTVVHPPQTESMRPKQPKKSAESNYKHNDLEILEEAEIKELCSEIQTLKSRFSIFESSLTNVSTDVLSINVAVLELQKAMKTDIIKVVKSAVSESLSKLNVNTAPQSENQEVIRLKKVIEDKDCLIKSQQETISTLNVKIQDNFELHESKVADIKRNYQLQISSLNSRIDNLNKENNITEEKLASCQLENDKLRKDLDLNSTKLNWKDHQISELNDRLETIRLDYEGGPWASTPIRNRAPVPNMSNPATENINDQQSTVCKDIQNVPSDLQQREAASMIIMEDLKDTPPPAESRNNLPNHDIVFIHDSIHKHIDYDQLMKNTNKNIKSEFAANLEQFESKLSAMKIKDDGILISHIGTNNIRHGDSASEVSKKYVNMIQRVTRKGHKVIVSLLSPVRQKELDKEITKFNQLITEFLGSNDKVTLCDNKNIRGANFLEKDGVHINKYDGTRKLAGNLKYTLCTVLGIRRHAEKKRRGYNYYYDQPDSNNIDRMTNIVTAAIRAATQGNRQPFSHRRNGYWY